MQGLPSAKTCASTKQRLVPMGVEVQGRGGLRLGQGQRRGWVLCPPQSPPAQGHTHLWRPLQWGPLQWHPRCHIPLPNPLSPLPSLPGQRQKHQLPGQPAPVMLRPAPPLVMQRHPIPVLQVQPTCVVQKHLQPVLQRLAPPEVPQRQVPLVMLQKQVAPVVQQRQVPPVVLQKQLT